MLRLRGAVLQLTACAIVGDRSLMSTCPVCGRDHEHEVSCADQPRDSRVGQVICDKYRVTRRIGEGGMASVYEARHMKLDRPFALKFLHPWLSADEEWLERFQREGLTGGALVSEHISAILDTGLTHDDAPYILMELLRGEDLGQRLAREGTLKPQDAIEIITQACHGLAVAHRAGVIHRDLKPENIFLCDRELGGILVKVLDFGIAKLRNAQQTRATKAGMVMGTPYYMSPEQAAGRGGIDHRSDLYALGVMLYELLSGEKPFTAEDHGAVLNKIVGAPTPQLSELCPMLSAELSAVVQRAIAKDPSERYQSAELFADELLRFWPHTRQASRSTSAFSLARARRRTEDVAHITSAEPRITVRVTGTRNTEPSPVTAFAPPESSRLELLSGTGAAARTSTGPIAVQRVIAVSAESPTESERELPEFGDPTEPDALLSLEEERAMRSPQTRGAPPKPDATPTASEVAPTSERQRENVGRYRAATERAESEPPPVQSDTRVDDDTPVPTAIQKVSLGRTLAPVFLGAAAVVLFLVSVFSRPDQAPRADTPPPEPSAASASGNDATPRLFEESALPSAPAEEPVELGVANDTPPTEPLVAEGAEDEGAEGEGAAPGAEQREAKRPVAEDGAGLGTLNVTSKPAAMLRIGGQLIGRTPKVGVELPVGDYRLELWHDLLGSQFKSVKIHEGTTTSVNIDMRREPPAPSASVASAGTSTSSPELAAPQPSAAPSASPQGADRCSPSYYVDAQGVRRVKPECL